MTESFSTMSLEEMADYFGISIVTKGSSYIDVDSLSDLDMELFDRKKIIPLCVENETLRALLKDPIDLDFIQSVELKTGYQIIPQICSDEEYEEIEKVVFERNRVLNSSASQISKELEDSFSDLSFSMNSLEEQSESEPVVKLSRLILDEAVELHASDIHIEPLDNGAVVRFRIDGMLRRHMELEVWLYQPLTSRLKLMGGMDIAEKRKPQDGQIRYRSKGDLFDLRVSTLPTHLGEKTVIRLLRQDTSFLTLDGVGLPPEALTTLKLIIEKPQGLFLVTGPTGSGKSSTLFAALNCIKEKEINITTIENPVEYKIPGVNQVQINEKAGITFAATLRSILRQDPDVILVGETRDKETADIALQAAQTGHLVFSTLHTNDSIAAITRLRDLGIPGYLIASSLAGVMAQRLVRRLCPHCVEQVQPTEALQIHWESVVGAFPFNEVPKATGCKECRFTGFDGRTGIFELFQITDGLRSLIAEERAEQEIRDYLKSGDFTTMISHGIQLINQAQTTVDEVLRVVTVTDRA